MIIRPVKRFDMRCWSNRSIISSHNKCFYFSRWLYASHAICRSETNSICWSTHRTDSKIWGINI